MAGRRAEGADDDDLRQASGAKHSQSGLILDLSSLAVNDRLRVHSMQDTGQGLLSKGWDQARRKWEFCSSGSRQSWS